MDSSGKVIRVDFRKSVKKITLDNRPMALVEQPHSASWEPAPAATIQVTDPGLMRPGIADLTQLVDHRIERQGGKRIHHLTFEHGQTVRLEISESGFAIWGAVVRLVTHIETPTRPEA